MRGVKLANKTNDAVQILTAALKRVKKVKRCFISEDVDIIQAQVQEAINILEEINESAVNEVDTYLHTRTAD